jgi:pimeloyl-ACP methyl ester carboxylesterase
MSRTLAAAAAALAVVSTIAATGSSAQQNASTPPDSLTLDAPAGNFAGKVDVPGGRELYLECRGAGSPTVIL